MKEQIERKYLINLSQLLNQFDIRKMNIKTAYWAGKNVRILSRVVKDLDELRTELTSTSVFKQFQTEISEASTDELKEEVKEKYKEVISEADKELTDFLEVKIDLPDFYKIKIDNIEGIDPEFIPTLFDLIDSE